MHSIICTPIYISSPLEAVIAALNLLELLANGPCQSTSPCMFQSSPLLEILPFFPPFDLRLLPDLAEEEVGLYISQQCNNEDSEAVTKQGRNCEYTNELTFEGLLVP